MRKIKYPGLVSEMARCGDTQKTISKLIGRTVSNVCLRFTGKKEWTIGEIEKICDYYGKTYEELFK